MEIEVLLTNQVYTLGKVGLVKLFELETHWICAHGNKERQEAKHLSLENVLKMHLLPYMTCMDYFTY